MLLGWVSVGLDAEFGMHDVVLLALSIVDVLGCECGVLDLILLS